MVGFEVILTINESYPVTTRKIRIPYGITFESLHKIIQIVFGFKDIHEYEFKFDDFPFTIKHIYKLSPDVINALREPVDKYFESFDKCRYTYGDWLLDINIQIIDYDEVYPKIDTVHGRYNPLEECGNVETFNKIVDIKRNSLDYDYNEFGNLVDMLKIINRKQVQKKFMIMFNIPYKEVNNRIVKLEIDPNYSLDKYF